MYEDRVNLACNSEGEEIETYASKSVLTRSSAFFSGLFSESSGPSTIRAARAAPREGELYSDLAVDTVLELLHAKALEAPRADGAKRADAVTERVKAEKVYQDERGYLRSEEVWVEREIARMPAMTLWAPEEELTVDVLVELCELAAMWLLEDIVPTLARIISNSTDLREAKEPGELLAVRRLAQNHIEVDGWADVLTAVERELRRFALDPRWSAATLAECTLGEACELIMMQGDAATSSSEKSDETPSYEALRRFLEVKDWQGPDASACKTLCTLRSMAAQQPCHVCVATSVLPNGSISCGLTLQSSGPALDAAPPPSAGPVRDALILVASVAAREFAMVLESLPHKHAVDEKRVLHAFLAWAAHPRRSLAALELVAPYVRFPLLPSRVILLQDPSFAGLALLARRSPVVKGLLAEALKCQQGTDGDESARASTVLAWCYRSPLAVGLGGKPLHELPSASEGSTGWFRLRARAGRNDCVPKLTAEEMVRLLTNSPAF